MAGPATGKGWVRNLYEIYKRQQQTENSTDLGLPILAVRQNSATDLAGTGGAFAFLQVDSSGRLRVLTESGDISYDEDTPHTSGDAGLMLLSVRQNSAGSLVSTGGDYSPLSVDGSGRLYVADEMGDVSYAEDAAHVSGDLGIMSLAVRQETASSLVSTGGDYSALSVDSSGRLYVADEAGDFTYLEDTPHTSGDAGVQMLAVRQGTAATLVSTGGDYSPLSVDGSGRLYVADEMGDVSYPEDSAHTSGDLGIMSLVVRQDSAGSLVGAAGDYSPLSVDAAGRLYVADEMGDVSYAEDSHHTSGDLGIMAFAVRQDSAASLVGATGDYSPLTVEGLFGALLVKAVGGEDMTTGQIESTNGAVVIYAAPGTGWRREVSLFSAQHSTTGVPVACSMMLLSATQEKCAIELSADTAFGGPMNFWPTMKLNENEALNLKLSVATAAVRYNLQSDLHPVG